MFLILSVCPEYIFIYYTEILTDISSQCRSCDKGKVKQPQADGRLNLICMFCEELTKWEMSTSYEEKKAQARRRAFLSQRRQIRCVCNCGCPKFWFCNQAQSAAVHCHPVTRLVCEVHASCVSAKMNCIEELTTSQYMWVSRSYLSNGN